MSRTKLRLAVAGLLILIMAFSLPGQSVAAPPPEAENLRVIIQVEPGADIENLARDYGGRLRHSFPGSIASVSLSEDKFERLRGDFRVKSVRLAVRVEATQDILDWGVDRIDAEKVWGGFEDATDVVGGRNAGDGIKVAIIDTGIDYNHPDLAANYQGGYDFANTDADPMDDNGHGTHVAGIVAASDNNSGVIGVAPEAYLYAVKVLDWRGYGYEDDVADGIWWCLDNEIQIISMSLGSDYDMPLVEQACAAADDAGLLVVAAAGNDGFNRWLINTVDYPARYDSVIAVGATDQNDARASFSRWYGSSTGPDLELAAPGEYIYSTYWNDTYATLSGTSMACPMVTGTAALVWRANPAYTNVQVRERLQNTAEDLGTPGRDWEFGYGLVDAEAAATSPADAPPTVSIVNPADGATVSGEVFIQVSASDDESIDKVEYRIDSGAYQPMVYSSGYWEATWDSTTAGDGSHTITAKATDSIGQESTDLITVTVNNVDQPPTVSITSPSNGDFVSGTIAITASASDDQGVSEVAFYIDDTPLATDNTAPYECLWDTTTASDDSHAIKTVVTDTASQTAQDTVTVTVDNTEPVVNVAEPAEGATVSGTITIKASVTDDNIDKVEYQIDGGSLASMSYNAPYWEASWDSTTVGNGAHTVTVQATDETGNSGSDTNNFTVDNQAQAQTLHVQSLEMTLFQWGGRIAYAMVTATVVDATGNPVASATVSGQWEGATTGTGYGITNTSGQVTFRSRLVRYPTSGTTFTFVIESVTKDGWTYDPSANGDFNGDGTPGDTQNSITVP